MEGAGMRRSRVEHVGLPIPHPYLLPMEGGVDRVSLEGVSRGATSPAIPRMSGALPSARFQTSSSTLLSLLGKFCHEG
jgi:hypothetical protein